MFPKKSPEYKLLFKLNTPQKIQTFLENIPFNHETKGETCLSAESVLRENKAHCIEGAFLACACLMHAGRKPRIVSLKAAKPDDDHIIVLFKEHGYFGALSKTNHAVLRYRDPIYKTVRELVMTYVHEYFLYTTGRKTLIGYTKPIDLMRFGTSWIDSTEDVFDIGNAIYNMPTIPLLPASQKGKLRKASLFERKVLRPQEWKQKVIQHKKKPS
jgi:hypothetical protein